MAVVAAATSDSLLADATALAKEFASASAKALALAIYVDGLGVTGLQASPGGGFAATADAQQYQAYVDYMKTVAQIFQGLAAQTPAFNFGSALAMIIGPTPLG